MTLSNNQVIVLSDAINAYSFPCVYYDFLNGRRIPQNNMRSVEEFIGNDLKSGNIEMVKNGLSNVLYWGFEQMGYRDLRVKRFRNQVTYGQLHDAAQLFADIHGDGLKKIKRITLPQFSGMSFISKLRMFLDPDNYVVLDQRILKMNDVSAQTVLKDIVFGKKDTQIRISENNIRVYVKWCRKCKGISESYFEKRLRAVDIERGFFTLIQGGRVELAAQILSRA